MPPEEPEINVEIVNPPEIPAPTVPEVVVVETAAPEAPNELALLVGSHSADIAFLKTAVEKLGYRADDVERTAEAAIDIAIAAPVAVGEEIEDVVEEIVTEEIPAPVEAVIVEEPQERAKKKSFFI